MACWGQPWRWVFASWAFILLVASLREGTPSLSSSRRRLQDLHRPLVRFESHLQDYSSFASVSSLLGGILRALWVSRARAERPGRASLCRRHRH